MKKHDSKELMHSHNFVFFWPHLVIHLLNVSITVIYKILFITVVLLGFLTSLSAIAQGFEERIEKLEVRFDSINDKTDRWKVGDVRYSVLPPSQFERLNPGWVLMDGRPVNNTEYQRLTGQSTIPNGQNMFVRGISMNAETSSRSPGDRQKASTARPDSAFWGHTVHSDSGRHEHSIIIQSSENSGRWSMNHGVGDENKVAQGEGGRNGHSERYLRVVGENSGGHHHDYIEIYRGGDEETRPVNIALFIYIKIDDRPIQLSSENN